MPKIIAPPANQLNTVTILNTIRTYADASYRNQIPELPADATLQDIMRVGESIIGSPNLANEVVPALINRIALAFIQAMAFNNPYVMLKKGYLEYGETVEEIFVDIARLFAFEPEKADQIELKNWGSNVKASYHAKNFSGQYRQSISFDQLKYAFTSYNGVASLMDTVIQGMYKAMQYDDMLLVKYLIIKSYTSGKLPTAVVSGTDYKVDGATIIGMANRFAFPSTNYNREGVLNNTRKEDLYIFMSAEYQADYAVNVLAYSFNRSDSELQGHVIMVDDWTTFDNDRFAELIQTTNQMELVTDAELAKMQNVVAFMADVKWFQIYDLLIRFESTRVASGLRWNNFLTHEGIVASSPYANALMFAKEVDAEPETLTAEIVTKDINGLGTVFGISIESDGVNTADHTAKLLGSAATATAMIAITPDGIVAMPANAEAIPLVASIGGTKYQTAEDSTLSPANNVGDTFTLTKVTA